MKVQVKTFIFLYLIISSPFVIAQKLPDLGSEARSILSIKNEKLVGEALMQQLRATGFICDDPIINNYLSRLGKRLITHTNTKNLRFTFFGIKDYSINAFSFLGGYIGINQGLILATDNENELAAVMSHEIAHVLQEHILRQLAEQRKLIPITIAEAIAAIAVGEPGLILPILSGNAQQMLNFSRSCEQEADQLGIQILANAEFDPQSMPAIFQHMNQQAQYQENTPEYILTHPIFKNRIAEAKDRANQYNYKQNPSSFDYCLIKARIEAKALEQDPEVLTKLKHKLINKTYKKLDTTLYGYTIALMEQYKYNKARDVLLNLANKYPNSLIIQLEMAELEVLMQQKSQALMRLEKLLSLFPNDSALTLKYAETLLYNKQPKLAKQHLLSHIKDSDSIDPQTYQLLSRAESAMGNYIGMYEANAEWYILHGNFLTALIQLDMALDLAKNKKFVQARIKKKQKEIDELQKQRKNI